MDYGPRFAVSDVRAWIGAVGAKTAFITPSSPWENGYCESFTLSRDEVFGDTWGDGEIVKSGKHSFVSLGSNGEQFSFLPLSWFKSLGEDGYTWPGCENWWFGFPVICWMQIFQSDKGAEGTVRLFAEVGPLSDVDGRKELVQAIQAAGTKAGIADIRFQKTAANEGKKYSKFLKDNIIAIKDVQDIEEISRAIQTLLKKFQPCFDAVAPVFGEFTQYAEEADE